MNKPAYTISDQIALLKHRGMLFKNESKARRLLNNISYYRLKGYWWDVQSDTVLHTFRSDVYFEDIIERYDFDRRLRIILFESITLIRNIIAHHARLWNRSMVKRPSMQLNNPAGAWLVRLLQPVQLNKPFAIISCMVYLCGFLQDSQDIKSKIVNLVNSYPNVPVYKLGFFNQWQSEPLWK